MIESCYQFTIVLKCSRERLWPSSSLLLVSSSVVVSRLHSMISSTLPIISLFEDSGHLVNLPLYAPFNTSKPKMKQFWGRIKKKQIAKLQCHWISISFLYRIFAIECTQVPSGKSNSNGFITRKRNVCVCICMHVMEHPHCALIWYGNLKQSTHSKPNGYC